ncbi:SDR family NAD(P)-dependent oxidoreductase [Sphingosinicella rhizophila]|uniref:Glucose 1-dehydrogenase n=1 Tax=Sphingosinicella rhizophila TaxID=3050082 RepID=A0ABU3Q5M1_9SPHN|nr:glucose 1-dehydrogenase [Sphingosinicella sp. GR2756]MDT9598713.1 glucose 1-dehydrogenase [Sphingosinicella sp. GR2756]
MGRLDNKVALVTGGASGIGKGIALRLAADGAKVIISDIQRALGEATAAEGGFEFLEQDASNEQRWDEIIGDIEQRHGKLDILVNNAGILGSVNNDPERTQLADWRKVFAVNLESVFLGCRAAIPAMRRAGGGSIVNIASVTAQMPTSMILPYGSSKAAVRQLTKSVAEYCAQQKLNIRCNSVHPGFIDTPAQLQGNEEIAKSRGLTVDQVRNGLKARVPMGAIGESEDIGAAVAFLASDDARYVTGAKLLVDGGMIMD